MILDESTVSRNPHSENTGYVLRITLIATLGGFLFGYDSGVINGTIDGLKIAFNSDSVGTGFNVASMLLGCAMGAFFAGHIADRYGRRSVLKVTALLFLVSAYGSGISSSSVEFVIYRILGGIAVGAASVLAPAYISEVAPARYRGAMTSINQVGIISGIFASFVCNYFLASAAGTSVDALWLNVEAWRWMFWMEIIPASLFFLLLFLIPESPRFLVFRAREDDAKKVLTKLFGELTAEEKIASIKSTQVSDHHRPRLSDLFIPKTKKLRKVVWAGVGLASFQQLVGINVVFYYGAVLWQAVGFAESDALRINMISGGVSITAVLLAIGIVDKVGRKPLLVVGSIGMAITLATMALCFGLATTAPDGKLLLGSISGVVALVAANLYVFFFNVSWGPVMWVMLGEMFPNQLRGSGLAVAGLSQWMSNFGITMTFPIMLGSIGLLGAYGFYAVSAVVSVFFVWHMVGETRGKELEDMSGD